MLLANSIYWPALTAAIVAGFALLLATIVRRRGWWWKLPFAFALLAGPYLADVVRGRMAEGESILNAAIPTSLLLQVMEPDTAWPYGSVFDRLHRAPPRHAMWSWQLDQLAQWCGRCVASPDSAMVKRGVQIAATLAARDCDAAIDPLAAALMLPHAEAATIACDALASLGKRAERVLPILESAAASAPFPAVRQRAAAILATLNSAEK